MQHFRGGLRSTWSTQDNNVVVTVGHTRGVPGKDLLAVKLHVPELKVSSSISAETEDDSPFSVFSSFEGDNMVEDCHFLE